MKKLVLLLVTVVGFFAAVIAQPRAIGGRIGWTVEASYQHGLGDTRFLEIDAGLVGYYSAQAAVIHDWIFASPNWTSKGTWDWYAGVGGAVGLGWRPEMRYNIYTGYYERHHYHYGFAGVAGQVGLSYTFWFPLQLSVDIRPTLGVWFNRNQVGFNGMGVWDFALSVRYAFGVR